jgi:DNA repair exonuclease SbcCD ATPase subunit
MYAEGMKLVKRYEEEEAELADKLKKLTGSSDGLLAAQRSPSTPLQRLASHQKEVAELVESLKAARAEAKGHAYREYALDKQLAFVSDPSNIAFEELELPHLIEEHFEIEMAELDAEEAKLVEAEEEELWMLTLQQQARHIAQHIEFDLPQAVVAHMDPLLYKKLDWELTNGQDLMHHEAVQAADCEQGEFIKDQMGLEHLSHHFLPLLRYRRQKYRKTLGYYPPELSAVPVKAKLIV